MRRAVDQAIAVRNRPSRAAGDRVACQHRVSEKLQATGLTVESIVRDGNPKKAIVAAAGEWSADLIVMGSQGHSGIAGLFLGNTAQTVMNHALCPVEIVPSKTVSNRASS